MRPIWSDRRRNCAIWLRMSGSDLPSDLDYRGIAGLSNEMAERLESARPDTLAAAGRIRGITPAALATILVHAKRATQKKAA